ncbi:MAG: N-acetyltransferase [Pseudomonadota bacterium]
MTDNLEIRESAPSDLEALKELYSGAFPDENLLPLVEKLLQNPPIVLSLVGLKGSSIVGHVIFTQCGLAECQNKLALLGPLAVAPRYQKQGVGSALVRGALEEQKRAGVLKVCVLGDPAYYQRFGFAPELGVTPPYPLPDEWQGAWQSIGLTEAKTPLKGALIVPEPWQDPVLWSN